VALCGGGGTPWRFDPLQADALKKTFTAPDRFWRRWLPEKIAQHFRRSTAPDQLVSPGLLTTGTCAIHFPAPLAAPSSNRWPGVRHWGGGRNYLGTMDRVQILRAFRFPSNPAKKRHLRQQPFAGATDVRKIIGVDQKAAGDFPERCSRAPALPARA